MRERKWRQVDLAKACRVAQQRISYAVNSGGPDMPVELAMAIERVTAGQVPASAWLPARRRSDPPPSQSAA
jgi:hypothetical protein